MDPSTDPLATMSVRQLLDRFAAGTSDEYDCHMVEEELTRRCSPPTVGPGEVVPVEEYRLLKRDHDAWRDKAELHRQKAEGEYWAWQGDGSDHLESLTCPVLIPAAELARLLSRPGPDAGFAAGVEAAAIVCEETDVEGDYHYNGEDSVWSSDAEATIRSAAKAIRKLKPPGADRDAGKAT